MRFISYIRLRATIGRSTSTYEPSCKGCMYYVPRDFPFTPDIGRCRRFGEQDPDTKEVTYELAELCRIEKHKCGKYGKYFVKI